MNRTLRAPALAALVAAGLMSRPPRLGPWNPRSGWSSRTGNACSGRRNSARPSTPSAAQPANAEGCSKARPAPLPPRSTLPRPARRDGSILRPRGRTAKENFLASELDQINAQAGSSLREKIDLLRQRRLTDRFRGYLDALFLTLEYRTFDELGTRFLLRLAGCREQLWPCIRRPSSGSDGSSRPRGSSGWRRSSTPGPGTCGRPTEVPDDRFTPLYALADLHRTRGGLP
ncbi:MAG: hypothetical protein M0C28_21810 [Candidatus Moduliflexus flocculans]|nr:hypothetical protein [Candidatus Moduliflexus flocculans]